MSNASLKEQLQSLGLSSAEENKPQPQKKKQPNSEASSKKAKLQKPAWLEQAQYGVELLKAYFPDCFKDLKEIQPLKIGIKQDIVKFLSTRDDIVIGDKACMVNSLAYYVNSPSYHKHMIAGATRIALDGTPAGAVTEEEAKYSQECRQSKFQKKKMDSTKENTSAKTSTPLRIEDGVK